MGYMQWTQPVSSDIPLFWIKVMFARFFHCNCTVPPFSYFGRELWRPMGSWRLEIICIRMTHVYLFYTLDFVAKFFPALTSGGLLGGLPCLLDLSLSSCFLSISWLSVTISSPDSFCILPVLAIESDHFFEESWFFLFWRGI